MTFKTDGFLSPTMEGFRASLREVPAYKLWLEFAEELNRLGWHMLEDHETPTTDNQRLIISVLFMRAHQSLQAAITLIEKGMLADARVVLRGAVEGAIALNALANDATFDRQLIEAHLHNQKKTAGIVLNAPEYRAGHTTAEIAQMEATIKEVTDQEVAANRKFRDVAWASVATSHCPNLYDLLYRSLSNDGTHTNVNAIHRFLEFDNSNRLTGLRFGPNTHDMVDVLKMACLMFMWAADPFARIHALQFQPQIADKLRQFDGMPGGEPPDVSVLARFDD
ncbi:DUF5677 domain-containing protein [Acidocella facilis]|uniref:DUF5677 domain-containing protein n=1 Tax=Acidocella facilis TaxID=525 RepID=UPI001F227625|nr:DUF5677 domain-containing protein [Acidocella facilis]